MDTLIGLTGNDFVIALALIFVAVLLLLEAGWLFWRTRRGSEARKLAQRLANLSDPGRAATGRLRLKNEQNKPAAWEAWVLSQPIGRDLHKMLHQSGMSWSLQRLLASSLVAAVIGWMALAVLAPQLPQIKILAAALAFCAPAGYLLWKRRKRLTQMELQLPATLDVLVRALRAGHAFSAGMQMMGEEGPEPLAVEFRAVHDEINFGVSLQQALFNLCARVPLTDLRYFVVAVLVQRDAGGNLTEVLAKLAQLIRERQKLLARVRVLSSEGRLSAWVLGLMPFFLAGAMFLGNREFMQPLWQDPLGLSIIKVTLGLMAVGVLILRKIVRIRI